MGQKVHPYILRVGFGKSWLSRWFSPKKREYADFLEEDLFIRDKIKKSYPLGSVATIDIERVSLGAIRIRVRTSRPGVIIGRRGQDIERVKKDLAVLSGKEVVVDVEEVSDQALEAQLVAELVAFQLKKRVKFRRAMKKAIQQATNSGGQGMKIQCSGRLGGVELARSESYKYGKIPLHTFRTDIDYGFAVADTTYGSIGVKVWVCKGQKLPGDYLSKNESGKD